MPGPVTILVQAKNVVPSYVTHNTGIIGIRVPGLKDLCSILNEIGTPLLVPSANRSGEKPALNSDEVRSIFGEEIDYVIDGTSGCQSPSTIIDLTENMPKIVRKGPISEEDILKVL